MEKTLRFVWFWTFWHWSKESCRAGVLKGDPLTGIAVHWNEWFQGVASEQDRTAIEEIGRKRGAQSQFVTWLFRHWAKDINFSGSRAVPRFAMGQLADVKPFSSWKAMDGYRKTYGATGVPAIILSEHSSGSAGDVRPIEALVLPTSDPSHRGEVISEGFKANTAELRRPVRLACDVFEGKSRRALLLLWLLAGRRAHGRWLTAILRLGWVLAVGLLSWLLFGPDPQELLPAYEVGLLLLWISLATVAVWNALREARHLWREGRVWSRRLAEGEVRLRANIGLTVEGGSAGLAFALNAMLASYRSGAGAVPRSWIWRRVFQSLDRNGRQWAATGVVTPDGWISPVVLMPKLRACFQHVGIKGVLIPAQRDASGRALENIRETLPPQFSPREAALTAVTPRYGFASGAIAMHVQRCRHIVQGLMSLGGLVSPGQIATNLTAVAATAMICAGAADLRSTLLPTPPPMAVAPSSSSPYYLWVSLDTPRASDFCVVFESRFWTYRRANVVAHSGPDGSNRAEIRLLRSSHPRSTNVDDGVVWVERRRKFLWRDFMPGERVGQFTLSYLHRIGRE